MKTDHKFEPLYEKMDFLLSSEHDLSIKQNLVILCQLYKSIVFDMRNELCISKTLKLIKTYSYRKIMIKCGAAHMDGIIEGLSVNQIVCLTLSDLSNKTNPSDITLSELEQIIS